MRLNFKSFKCELNNYTNTFSLFQNKEKKNISKVKSKLPKVAPRAPHS